MKSTIASEPGEFQYQSKESWLTFILWKVFETLFGIGQLIFIWAICIGVSMFMGFTD